SAVRAHLQCLTADTRRKCALAHRAFRAPARTLQGVPLALRCAAPNAVIVVAQRIHETLYPDWTAPAHLQCVLRCFPHAIGNVPRVVQSLRRTGTRGTRSPVSVQLTPAAERHSRPCEWRWRFGPETRE